jgi:hypothetical protein
MTEGSVVLPPMSSVEHFIMPTAETFLKTAAYFEDRARRTRQSDKRERMLAAAQKYRERAAAADLNGDQPNPRRKALARQIYERASAQAPTSVTSAVRR